MKHSMSMGNSQPDNNSSSQQQQQQQQEHDDIERQQKKVQQQKESSGRNRQPYIFILNENSSLLQDKNNKDDDNNTSNTYRESSSCSSSSSSDDKTSFWSFAINFWNWYDRQLRENPVITKSLTASIIVSMGDFCGQYIEHRRNPNEEEYDLARIGRFFLLGGILQAPVTHYYFAALDAKFPPKLNNPWTSTTFLKLAIDQLLFAPTFTLVLFFFLDTLQCKSWDYQLHHLEDEYSRTMIDNWKLWIPAVLLNFAFCPPKLRVLYNNVIFFVWSICLSLLLDTTTPTTTTTTDHSNR